jgi:Beta-lactamase
VCAEANSKKRGDMSFIDPTEQRGPVDFSQLPETLDTQAAREAYLLATENPLNCHVEVGIVHLNGELTETRLGKDEAYGAHRVGSVTKTFTSFLALKLVNEGVISLGTKCGELIDRELLQTVFADPDAAAEMTLEQLLSHTSGLECDDHNREESGLNLLTMHARFIREGEVGNKYKHTCQPGDGIGFYSNAGLAVAAWMIEVAYNAVKDNEPPTVSFSQIMRDELFSKVFDLSEGSHISPGPSGDVIGAGAGDMTSSVRDLLKVAQCLQQGEEHLVHHFGSGWHQTMLAPRDLFAHHGLGCSANALSIQHAGLNYEIFEDGVGRDVTALAIFPLGKEQPGLVAMCDSNALGPLPNQVKFARELKSLAGIEAQARPINVYELDFYCPTSVTAQVFTGDAYVITNIDPFSIPAADEITLSRNGMKHELIRDPSIDAKDATGYQDANGKPWMVISKGERKMIYSDYCLVSASPDLLEALMQPSKEQIQAIQGVYKDVENPDENPTFSFNEQEGQLVFQEGNDKTRYPALFLPGENFWVVSLPSGRKNIKFRFPADPSKEPLTIVDIAKKIESPLATIAELDKLPPKHSVRK